MKAVVEKLGTWYEDKSRLEEGMLTSKLYPYTAMFSPIQVNSTKIKIVWSWGRWATSAWRKKRDAPTRK